MFKKLFSLLVCFTLFVCTFTASVTAARTGEFETHDVEFQAFVSNGVVEPIEITLTHVTDNYKLYYYLYAGNNYISNEPVALGEYSVDVMVSGYEASEFDYIYEKTLKVEPASTAISFTIIADQVLEDGDYSGEADSSAGNEIANNEGSDNGETTVAPADGEKDEVKEEEPSGASEGDASQDMQEEVLKESPYSLLISLGISLLLLGVVGFILWWMKNR